MSDKPPQGLIEAFRAAEQPTDIGVLMSEDGFDAMLMKVISSWEKTSQRWKKPKKPCPDEARPTTDAWLWLVSGWTIDYAGIAAGAGVSRDVARLRVATLLHARLIYPDGSIAKAARNAMTAALRARLMAAGAKPKKDEKKDDGKVN